MSSEDSIAESSFCPHLPWETFRMPIACLNEPIVIGIDEAGRGPVLGSLVYGAAFWPLSMDETIQQLKFADSKTLSYEQRVKLLEIIRNHPAIGWVIDEIDSKVISEEMFAPNPISLNELSYSAVVRMLKRITTGKNAPIITTVYIDTIGDPETYRHRLESSLGTDFGTFIIETKADAKFKTVSAASIVAKVSRDHITHNWKWREPGINYPCNFGSGYPGDPAVVQWLENHYDKVFGFPDFVRFSWSTTKELLKRPDFVNVKWEAEDEAAGSMNLMNMFGSSKKRRRSAYFTRNKLTRIEDWDNL